MAVGLGRSVCLICVAGVGCTICVASCENALGISGPVTLSTDACGLQARAGDCRTCVATQCCNEATACAKDPACAPLESCLLGCGSDYTCRSFCVGNNQFDPAPNAPTLDACVGLRCSDACGLSCGMSTAFAPADAAQGCEDCLNRNCGATTACTTDLGCQLVGHCLASCFTPDCRGQCLQNDAGALSEAGALFLASGAQAGLYCLQLCDIGGLWQCVGKVGFPMAQPGPSDVALTLQDQDTGAGLPNLVVKACPMSTDRSCASPISMGTTDQSGTVLLPLATVPANAYGFWGYFDLTWPVTPPLHYLFFLSFPLSVAHAQLIEAIYTPGELGNLFAIPPYQPDPSRGILQVVAADCLTLPAPNVTFVAEGTDAHTLTVYRQGTYLNTAATSTDRSGMVFFLNAPAVPIKVEATPAGFVTPSSVVNVFVRPGAVSIVQAIPTQQ
jgi:hypothetical protein